MGLATKVSHDRGLCTCVIWLIGTDWRTYASLNYVMAGSDNGLSSDWRQAIIRTNIYIMLIVSLETNYRAIWMKY